jgi:hypothetical protein
MLSFLYLTKETAQIKQITQSLEPRWMQHFGLDEIGNMTLPNFNEMGTKLYIALDYFIVTLIYRGNSRHGPEIGYSARTQIESL